MSSSGTLSAKQRPAPLTPEQRFEGETNLTHLLMVAHDRGVPAALKEWDRLMGEKRASSQEHGTRVRRQTR
jgi:hypothetical protein